MKRGYVYTIVFMLVVSAVFTLFLAGANAFLTPRILANTRIAEQKSILNAFNIEDEGTDEEIEQRFSELVQPKTSGELEYYEHIDSEGTLQGVAVPFTGSGLWGTIRGWLATTPELDEIQGLVFTEQNETPGLGGRIMEEWYLEQFRGVGLDPDSDFAYGTTDTQDVDAISGATQTSNAIVRIVNQVKNEVLPQVEVR